MNSGRTSNSTAIGKGYKALLDEANAEVLARPPAEAAGLLADGGTLFIDIRDPRELDREGRIAEAHHCPRGMLEFWIDPESPYHREIFSSGKHLIFFCAGGWRSAFAAKTAQDMGLDDVSHMEGGFSAWKAAGLPHEPGTGKARTG